MLEAHKLDAITIHRDEIKALARETDPTRAIKRALDFARDFSDGRKFENEAVALSSQFNRVREDQRKGLRTPTDIDAALLTIIHRLLELTDNIYDGFVSKTTIQVALATQPEFKKVDATQPEEASPHDSESLERHHNVVISFEEARRRYKEKWHEGETENELVAFRCDKLGKRYGGTTHDFLLSDVSVELKAGEITGLVGVNGAGKTTLLRIIAGQIAHSTGELSYPLLGSGSLDWPAIRHCVGYVQQLPDPWYGKLADNLHLHAANHGLKAWENRAETNFILQRLGLDMYRDATWHQISGGYKMRFELARVLVTRPRLLILDEPLAPLDIVTQQMFLKDLRDLANSLHNPLPIVVSSQHLYEIEAIADRMLFLDDGKPIFYGAPADIGADRAYNMFEISCALTSLQLYEILDGLDDLYIEECGLHYVIRAPLSVTAGTVVRRLANADVSIQYFRDLSCSSRILFDSRGRPS